MILDNHTRTLLNTTDTNASNLIDIIEDAQMSSIEITPNQEELVECLQNLNTLITQEQENQGWI